MDKRRKRNRPAHRVNTHLYIFHAPFAIRHSQVIINEVEIAMKWCGNVTKVKEKVNFI